MNIQMVITSCEVSSFGKVVKDFSSYHVLERSLQDSYCEGRPQALKVYNKIFYSYLVFLNCVKSFSNTFIQFLSIQPKKYINLSICLF